MTEPATLAATPAARRGYDDLLRTAVIGVVQPLQRLQLAGVATAAARLARLRRALTSAPGSVPEAWADTVGALPRELVGRGDAPSAYEWATHAAVCLYAVHQQSQPVDMHVPRRNLGGAVLALQRSRSSGDEADPPVLRRFYALATATDFVETLQHLRGLVTLFRSERVGLDYGQLAVDLRRLQQPGTALGVRLAWGRALYRRPRKPNDQSPTQQTRSASAETTGDDE